MHPATIVLLSAVFISSTESLDCNVLNTIQGISVMTCPANVYQCMKFVCKHGKSEQVYKGCNDYLNPPISCVNLMNNCQAQYGKGRCLACTGEMCNSAPSSLSFLASFLSIFTLVFLSSWYSS